MASSDSPALLAPDVRDQLGRGLAIPAHPLALTAGRRLDERRQRALTRYYLAAGAGGLAVGVHTTQFGIHDKRIGLFEPVLCLAKEEMDRADAQRTQPVVRIAGLCGETSQAVNEAQVAKDLGYHAGLVSLAALGQASVPELIDHCRAVSRIIPVFGFYLQPAVGGRVLTVDFWRRLFELPGVAAVKIAPFNRYQTLDVMRAAVESGREDLALYTGNDDNIILDLLTPYRLSNGAGNAGDQREAEGRVTRRMVGGLLGHWSVWTHRAVEHLALCRQAVRSGKGATDELLDLAVRVTDANAAFFDAANGFAGCIAGLHEVLRRQGLLEGIWCLDENEGLGPGQREQIDRVYQAYPDLNDDDFVRQHLDQWLSG